MINCEICQAVLKTNKDGSFTKHLFEQHNCTLEEYVIKFQYHNQPPKCQCGLCNDISKFDRGKFKKYAFGHNKNEWYQINYIKKYGQPLCKTCGKPTEIRRKKFKQYCSYECGGKQHGFSKKSTQDTIRKHLQEKYGVDNVLELDFVRKKLSSTLKGKTLGRKATPSTRLKNSIASKKMWNNPIQRAKLMKSFHSASFMLKRMKHLKTKIGSHSKLHDKIQKELNLINLGFISEQIVGNYIVDEINIAKHLIIEINGDHVHANPAKYQPLSLIKMVGNSYTAQEKWDSDRLKKENLEKLGYKVIVIWESDNLDEKRKEIKNALESSDKYFK